MRLFGSKKTTVWDLEAQPLPTGRSLLQHVEQLLPPSGRGPLPRGGEPLPDAEPDVPGQIRWSAGSFDAVLAVRGGSDRGNPAPVAAAAVLKALRQPLSTESLGIVLDRLNEVEGPLAIDRFLGAILEDQHFDRGRLATLARWICRNGTRRNEVKCAMAMLGVSGTDSDAALLSQLGLLEELALYALVGLDNLLPDSEAAIFDLTQQLSGWGRIHGVRRLKNTTNPRVMRWLVLGGAENDVMTEEVAYIAATTGQLHELLQEDLADQDLSHAGELLRALAVGGPAEDMSQYPHCELALLRFSKKAINAAPTLQLLDQLVVLERYVACDGANNPLISPSALSEISSSIERNLARDVWTQLLRRTTGSTDPAEFRSSITFGHRFGVDVRTPLIAWLKREPHDSYLWQELLCHADTRDMDECLELARTCLSLDALQTGPAEDLGLGLEYAAEHAVLQVLQRLVDFPGMGSDFVETGLRNRVVVLRNTAMRVLESWPRDAWPETACETLRKAEWVEPRKEIRERIRTLLNECG